jgi:hypothetical protein
VQSTGKSAVGNLPVPTNSFSSLTKCMFRDNASLPTASTPRLLRRSVAQAH